MAFLIWIFLEEDFFIWVIPLVIYGDVNMVSKYLHTHVHTVNSKIPPDLIGMPLLIVKANSNIFLAFSSAYIQISL